MAGTTARYHHGDLRRALLTRAERKLETTGVEGLSLRDLARDVGVSHSAPRRHFPDKQALLDALAVQGLERLGDQLDAALADSTGTFGARMTAFASAYVDFATRHPALLALMFARKDRPDAPELREANDRAFAAPSALIAQAEADGVITSDDPDQVAMAVLATLQGLASIITSDMIGERSADTVVAGTVDVLLHGLLRHGDASENLTPPRLT